MDAVISLETRRSAELTPPAPAAESETHIPAPDLPRSADVLEARLLIADGDRNRRDLVAANFRADGYETMTAPNAQSTLTMMMQTRVGLLIVDAAIVTGPGTALLTEIRSGEGPVRRLAAGQQLDPDVPVIVTASRRDDLACIRALDAGSDDYLTAPFTYMELRARVRALLRRQSRSAERARLRVGALELDAVARQAWVGGQRLRLSSTEFSLLHALATEPTRMFSRAEILSLIWGWADKTVPRANTRTLDSHISRLRRKLRAAGLGYVVNVWGQGYRLITATSLDEPAELEETAELIPIARAA